MHTDTITPDTTITDHITADAAGIGWSHHSKRVLGAAFLAATLFLAACGSDGDSDAGPVTEAPAATQAGAVTISTGSTDVGDVLVDGNGLSLYGFLPDEGGTPTCGGGCAEAWPPILVPSADLPAGLDADVFGVVEGLEGGFHLTANDWPLYLFAGDAAPGDITGQGSGGNWFLVAPDGSLITDEAAAPAPATETESSDSYGY